MAMKASGADQSKKKLLQERVPLRRTAWKLAEFFVLFLLLALLAHRATGLDAGGVAWQVAFVCEAWFTFVWLLNMNVKWNPVRFVTYPENLAERIEELPVVDMFVTTADPVLEPPLVTANTVLSLLSVDYPDAGEKLACYISDDGCSPVTFYAMRETVKFSRMWVPFCRRHNIAVRAPFRYFTSTPDFGPAGHKFRDDWTFMKSEYEKLVHRIEDADERSLLRHGGPDFCEFMDVERANHPAIVKVLWDNSKSSIGEGFPHLIYVSREKSLSHHHHYKAGAMNTLTRVSAVMTNAPIMLNVDCDMFANNPQVVLHAMCLLLGFDNEIYSGFVQAPQKFYGALKDDPFGNQMEVIFKKLGSGVAGLQGMFYGGTGCFHRRKVIYGMSPDSIMAGREGITGSPSAKELQKKFGISNELKESARKIISANLASEPIVDMSSRIEIAKEVAACNYEIGTHWGHEIGWVYGSLTEDVLTGQRIHAMGWRSTMLDPEPPAFLGCAPTGGPACQTQFKRWATGLFEILIGQNNPILATIFKHLHLRQCLSYLIIYVWPLRGFVEVCYALLGPYCLLTNQSFLPKASEDGFNIPLALFLTYNTYNLVEYMECGLSTHAWWNNHRMQRITSASAWLLAFLIVLLKTLGLSETVFEVTRKDKSTSHDDDVIDEADPGRFTFDASPVFIPVTTLVMLNIVAITIGAWRVVFRTMESEHSAPGVNEFMCCGWLLLCFLPFVRGLVGKGSYGIPWSVMLKASLVVAIY
uniref:Glycosyltransferase 2-like domain-containing protein n=1 Tax=Leersia perrieri TaxID=77586 RepID=A0A0D9W501_9ORYZ